MCYRWQGRYSFANQPNSALWNLSRLALTLRNLIGAQTKAAEPDVSAENRDAESLGADTAAEILWRFEPMFMTAFARRMREKLGLLSEEPSDLDDVVAPLLNVLSAGKIDYSRFFRRLSSFDPFAASPRQLLDAVSPSPPDAEQAAAFEAWAEAYKARIGRDSGGKNPAEREARMKKVNPKFVLT
ncbi:MAG: hypothetical protein BJ554DRAFT_957 [Olpidium bornovanus]|uniref:Selenoprotein O n=1 Tax=Olpidium bornovanus TaxID=278681 RepID=A0A8H7ZSV7_9FUNG|nr:MAG: hypothetical protein BJ554DRAFT_957 [Olpidium bornovanus]